MKKLMIGGSMIPPFGEVWVAVSSAGLFSLSFPSTRPSFVASLGHKDEVEVVEDAAAVKIVFDQLNEYALGNRRQFDLPIDWGGMGEFQKKALKATSEIPFGQFSTYGQIAAKVGNPKGARAVGRAEATNPIPLVIPCHRVLGSDHQLHGYGAGTGLPTKQWLLDHEGVKL